MAIKNHLFVLLLLLPLLVSAQSVKSVDQIAWEAYQDTVLRDNAVGLIVQVGKRSSDLDIRERLELRLQTSVVLWKYDERAAFELLKASWQDTFSDEIHNDFYADFQRKKIYGFAAKVVPEQAKKWLNEMTGKKQEDDKPADNNKIFTDRQKADLILRSSIANLAANPQGSVSVAISSLSQTGKISGEFRSLIDGLATIKRFDLVSATYDGILAFAKGRFAIEELDQRAVIGLILNPNASEENRSNLLEFLLSSGRQIVATQNANQNIPKLSPDEMFAVYRGFALSLRPYVQQRMFPGLAALDEVLRELAVFIPADKLSDPMLSPSGVEKQIEDADKTVGSKERDLKFMKIASWLLSKRKRDTSDPLKVADSIADKISDVRTRDNLRDFVKLGRIERLVDDKDYSAAEKIARSITSLEIRSWALMALGESQKNGVAQSLELYDASHTVLQKSPPTHYKTQLSFILCSLMVKSDEVKSLEILEDAAKYSALGEDVDAKEAWSELYISSTIGSLNFTSTDLATKANEIFIPDAVGKLVNGRWDYVVGISKTIHPIRLQLDFQLMLASSALEHIKKVK